MQFTCNCDFLTWVFNKNLSLLLMRVKRNFYLSESTWDGFALKKVADAVNVNVYRGE